MEQLSKRVNRTGKLTGFLLPLTRITATLRLEVRMSVIEKQSSQETELRWSGDENGCGPVLRALCLGAAVEILNLLDADGADHTYTAREFAAVIYKNIRANIAV